ncbi:hypothetical protein [Clostridium lacusfryxellense]|uniref:hypothetical protein n=1 Tax=Clostridium lacusfryxellense TaxID=205328 RepID=UPI001C0B3C33|nr:hypothetical protein [Clostridium lacusfryxellense]MBU3114758.1 hypothetical protein [Clostridium lacusfryxellense]
MTKKAFEDLCIMDGGYKNIKYGVRTLLKLENEPNTFLHFYFEEGTTDEDIFNMKVALKNTDKRSFKVTYNANIPNSKELLKYLLTFKIALEYRDENDDIYKVFSYNFIDNFEKIRNFYNIKVNKDFYKIINKYFNL